MLPESFVFKTCHCRNITVQGIKVDRLTKTGLSLALQQKVIANKQSLLQVRSGYVDIENDKDVIVTKYSDSHCTIQCKKCCSILNLYYGKGNAFAQFSVNKLQYLGIDTTINSSMNSSNSPVNQTNLHGIPKALSSLIKPKPNDSQACISQSSDEDEYNTKDVMTPSDVFDDDSNDDDFDLMFSSATAPIVGSYTESPMSFTHVIFA